MRKAKKDAVAVIKVAEQKDIVYDGEICGFPKVSSDMVFPYVIIFLCLRGSATALYDLRKIRVEKNTLAVIMPQHIVQPLECSEDFAYMRVTISPKIKEEVKQYILGHDYDLFHKTPTCPLTEIQAMRVRALADLINAIAQHDTNDLMMRKQLLLSQIATAYEFIHYYRREEDKRLVEVKLADVYNRFAELVIEHYKENRNVNYYAALMNYDPQYFSKLFRQASGGIAPLQWIQQYVVTRAKLLMDANPQKTIKETAYELGFPTTANFCRYFKRATGIYPQAYKQHHEG